MAVGAVDFPFVFLQQSVVILQSPAVSCYSPASSSLLILCYCCLVSRIQWAQYLTVLVASAREGGAPHYEMCASVREGGAPRCELGASAREGGAPRNERSRGL